MEGNMQEYLTEKEAREKRLAVYDVRNTLGSDPNVGNLAST